MRTPVAVLVVVVLLVGTGCDAVLQEAEATVVPGAAATLTRSERTPIPTPVHSPVPLLGEPSPIASAAAAPVASPSAGSAVSVDADTEATRAKLQAALATPDLAGIEDVLLDHVSLSSAAGGQVLDRDGAAAWLRDHAGPGLSVDQVQRSSLSLQLEIVTGGWPAQAPLTEGQITFNFHRYAADGTQDEQNGTWESDTLDVE